MLPVEELYMNPKNPRKITTGSINSLMASIESDPTFLKSRPILVNYINKRYVIYAGMQRFEACRKLGMKEVPVCVDKNLPEEVIEYRMLADNVHQGVWDEDKLRTDFSEDLQSIVHKMRKANPNIDLEANKEAKKSGTQDEGSKKERKYWVNLTFQFKEDLTNFYAIADYLLGVYPDTTLPGRLIMFMTDTMNANPSEEASD